MKMQRLTPVLLVDAIQRALAFWVDRLGFTKTGEVPHEGRLGFVILERDGIQIMYQSLESVAADVPPLAKSPQRGTFLYTHMRGFMRRFDSIVLAAVGLVLISYTSAAQGGMEASRNVAGGGVSVPGWTGKVDQNEEKNGQKLENAKLAKEGNALHVTTGPAVTYWNPANKASGDYTVKATFTEPKYMSLNDHPHPYGIMIAGNDLGTDQQSFLYCAAYGTGTFIVRGFGPAPFRMNGGRGEMNAAVHKAEGPGQPVTQDIAVSVKGDRVECAINGTVVGSYDKSAVVGAGKLKSTDGVYGVRFAHNTEGMVTGLTMRKP